MTITRYGIPHCDQIKKTLAWFSEAELAVVFHDYKKVGISPATLKVWANTVANPSLIKRPVVVAGDRVLVGYDPTAFATLAKNTEARR